jgi:methyl-accepting chemotaxis protein
VTDSEQFVVTVKDQLNALHDMGVKMAEAYIADGVSEGNRIMQGAGGFDELASAMAETLQKQVDVLELGVSTARDELKAAEETSFTMTTAFSMVFIGLICAVMYVLYTRVIPPLQKLRRSIGELNAGEGDLTRALPVDGNDEVSHIVTEFNQFMGTFRTLVNSLNEFMSELGSVTEKIVNIADSTSKELNQQQAETEQVATAVNEMSSTVQEVANSAAGTAEATQQAHIEASNGRNVVAETMSAIDALAEEVKKASGVMERLEMDSEGIGTVLDVIRDIADQTNLLALNAAIEAARAGEQGRGFAVVADEVRTLASRTQQSTQEIQQMIERLQSAAREAVQVMEQGSEQAENSVMQAAKAGESLDAITDAVGTISDMSSQIASAAEEQSATSEEISRNVESIRGRGEETTRGAEEAAACTESLATLTDRLRGLIGNYKV